MNHYLCSKNMNYEEEKQKVRERVDYDAMFGEEMIKRIAKMGFKLKSYGDVGNGRISLNFTKE